MVENKSNFAEKNIFDLLWAKNIHHIFSFVKGRLFQKKKKKFSSLFQILCSNELSSFSKLSIGKKVALDRTGIGLGSGLKTRAHKLGNQNQPSKPRQKETVQSSKNTKKSMGSTGQFEKPGQSSSSMGKTLADSKLEKSRLFPALARETKREGTGGRSGLLSI